MKKTRRTQPTVSHRKRPLFSKWDRKLIWGYGKRKTSSLFCKNRNQQGGLPQSSMLQQKNCLLTSKTDIWSMIANWFWVTVVTMTLDDVFLDSSYHLHRNNAHWHLQSTTIFENWLKVSLQLNLWQWGYTVSHSVNRYASRDGNF